MQNKSKAAIPLIVLGLLGLGMYNSINLFGGLYNNLVSYKQSVHSAIADLETEYQRRYALVDNLVTIVKETKLFEKYLVQVERDIYVRVAKAKAAATKMDLSMPGTVQKKIKSENDLSQILTNAMDKLMVLAQHYPQITDPKVKDRTETFESLKTLRRELKDIEENIAYHRKLVNERVRAYNQTTRVWPSNVIADMGGFKEMPYFKVHSKKARQDVKISF